jgi:hypothetical protein
VARIESLVFTAPSPEDALSGVMSLTPAMPDFHTVGDDQLEPSEGWYAGWLLNQVRTGKARGCPCDMPGCHCDGFAGSLPDSGICGCCMAECPDAHDDWEEHRSHNNEDEGEDS